MAVDAFGRRMATARPALGSLITTDGQLQWRTLLLGRGTPYRWQSLTGWRRMVDVDSGDVDRPADHGAWAGRWLARSRIVTLAGTVVASRAVMGEVLDALEAVTALGEDATEYPLVVQSLGRRLMAWGRVSGYEVALDAQVTAGSTPLALQWTCTDPRRYSPGEYLLHLAIAAAAVDGLHYPLVYPLDYGASAAVISTGTATNAGTAPCAPTLTITGPIEGPLIVNQTTGAQLEYDITLTATDTLVIDCQAGTVLLNGTDRAYTATAASWPPRTFAVAAGDNTIALRALSASPGNGLDLTWRDGWW
jgi:hypothetical protein